jgi:hypothetical protein
VQLHYTALGIGDIISNFTFRFPPKTGHFYHVPSISLVSEVEASVWETQFGRVELVSAIVDTDYDNWAVLVQCNKMEGVSEPSFLSTRVLSRTRTPGTSAWIAITSAIEAADASAKYKYPVDQDVCDNTD